MKLERLLMTLGILRPIAKAMPVVGTPLEAGFEAAIKICEFAQGVKTNKKDSVELARRAAQDLESIVRVTKDTDLQTRGVLKEHINKLCSVLEKIRTSLEKRSADGTRNALWNRAKIADDIKVLKDELEDVTKRFSIAAQFYQEIAMRKLIGKAEHDTLNQLNPISQGYLDTVDAWSGCLQNTRVQLLSDLFHWIDHPGVQPPIFWLSGLAGTGKSTIATSLSERLQQHNKDDSSPLLGAWFFCSRQYAQCTVACNIVLTLAYQLALLHYDFRHYICTTLDTKPDLVKRPLEQLISSLIQEPLQHLNLSVLFMIDVLDECEHNGGRILSLLTAAAGHLQGRLKLIITSRPEHGIQQMFHRLEQTMFALHDMDTAVVQSDITSYLIHEFQQIKEDHGIQDPDWPSAQAITSLVNRSGTLFIYAATVVKFIAQSAYDPQELLQNILTQPAVDPAQGLPYQHVDLLYTQVLEATVADAQGKSQKDALSARISTTVGTIIFLQSPLSANALVTLLKSNVISMNHDIHRLSAVLLIPSDLALPVKIFHPSFRDFLVDANRCTDSRFLINEQDMHTQIALHCLHLMNNELHFNMTSQLILPYLNSILSIEEMQKTFSQALQYACKYWIHHISLARTNHGPLISELEKFGKEKILNWVEAASLLCVLPMIINMLPQVEQWATTITELTNVAIILHDTQRICQVFYPAISKGCMDVYHSAMALGPEIPIRRFSSQLSPGWPHVQLVSAKKLHWDALLQVINVGSGVTSASFSPDSKHIVSGSKEKTVIIWDAATGGLVLVLKGHTHYVRSCSFSPDGKHIVSGSEDKTVMIWDAVTGRQVSVLKGHTDYVNSCNFSPNGKHIVSGSDDNTVRIWDAVTAEELSVLKGHTGHVNVCSFSPDGKYIVSGSHDETVKIWDAVTRVQVSVLEGHTGGVSTCSFSPNSKHIVSGSWDETVRIWEAVKRAQVLVLTGHRSTVTSCGFSSDGKHIISGSIDSTVRVWDAARGTQVSVLKGHTKYVTSCSFSPDGKHIVSGSDDQTLRIWDADTGAEASFLEGHRHIVNSCSFSPDGKHIVSASNDRTMKLWDGVTGAVISVLVGHTRIVNSCSFSPDGKHIVSGSDDQTIRMWDVDTAGRVSILEGHTGRVSSCNFSPDGKHIVSGSNDKSVRIWDAVTGTMVSVLKGHTDYVNSCNFSANGKHIVSGSNDTTVRIWNTITGAQVSVLKDHSQYVTSCSFSPEGKYIVSGSDDQTMTIWDVMTHSCIATISCPNIHLQFLPGTTTLLLCMFQMDTPHELDVITHYMHGLSLQTVWLDKEGFLYVNSQLICWITLDRRPVGPAAITMSYHEETTVIVLGSKTGLVTIVDVTAAMSQ